MRAAIWKGDATVARRFRDAHQIAAPGRRTDAHRATMDAGIAMLEGRTADARTLYATAQRIWREIGANFWLAITGLDIVTTGAMEADERRRVADEAREIFTGLRATALLALLDAALTKGSLLSAAAPLATADASDQVAPRIR